MRHQWEPDEASKMTPKGRERSTCRRCGLERRFLGQRWTNYYRGGESVGERAGACDIGEDVTEARASVRMVSLEVEIDGRQVTAEEGATAIAEASGLLSPALAKAFAGTLMNFFGIPGGEELQARGASEHGAELAERYHRERRGK